MNQRTAFRLIQSPLLLIVAMIVTEIAAAEAIPVRIQSGSAGTGFQLMRNDIPYPIKGAGGKQHFDRLAEYGGNSIRTWSTENARAVLDQAQRSGLTVTLGLWMGHENHGFDYNDRKVVARQLERFRQDVLEFKDHPALLMWAVGNEVNLNYSNPRVWDALEEAAEMISRVDRNHPVMTVIAGAPRADVQSILEKCPHVDVLGINAYAALGSIPSEVAAAGWNGPMVITEWGPDGYWEVPATAWGAALEQNSSDKAETYRARYEQVILPASDRVLGSYVFLWGHKDEVTPTWFGMFLDDGRETAMVDTIRYLWNGVWPDNRAPEIGDPAIADSTSAEDTRLEPAIEYRMDTYLLDPEGDPLTLEWVIRDRNGTPVDGSGPYGTGAKAWVQGDEATVQFTAPQQPGAYRLYLYAFDDHNHAATANLPLLVD